MEALSTAISGLRRLARRWKSGGLAAFKVKSQLELQLQIRGTQGVGWEGAAFTEEEVRMGRLWLEAKSISIAGGSNEVQLNIIAKRVLGLPD